MNQLVRENLYYGENNSANSTYTYAYDSYGNMLGKYRYAYTTGSIANKLGITVAEYQYTDSQWGDLLTAVTDGTVSTVSKQNSTVSYDEMGNPTRYFGAAMTWAGKQLKYWGKSGKYVNFAYNEDGIRTLKNSNGVVTNYYYNGSLLIGMTVGSGSSTRILRFSYDSSGSVVAVDYSTDNGTTFNTYYYLRNAQNDIVKLIDSSGSTVVEYCYDSWGKPLSTSGSLASTLGKNNPFRYRGYVYDEETGFYYLQSRYYNPEVGRFISSDVLLSTGQGVLGHNAYAYCLNNPVNMSDETGMWPSWAKKIVAAVAVVAVVAAVAAITVATAGAGTAAAVIAVGAAKGAAIGMASGAAMGAATGALSHRVSTGSWNGAGTAALNGMGNGALSGAVTGAITGAAGSAIKVSQAAKAWDRGTLKSGYQSMKYHYKKHVIDEGLTNGNNVLKFTQDAIDFAKRNASTLKYTYNYKYSNASWNLTFSNGQGDMFTSLGKILTFWYR